MKHNTVVLLTRFIECLKLVVLFVFITSSFAFAQDPYQRVVRRINPSEFDIPLVSGLGFSPAADAFLVVTAPGASEIMLFDEIGELSGSTKIGTAIADPLNIAFDSKSNNLVFSDPDANQLIEINMGTNARLKPSSETIARFRIPQLDLRNAKGLAFNPESGELFILDARGPRIIRIIPGPQYRFEGSSAEKDGRISMIELSSLQGLELRGIAFNPGNNHLYVMAPKDRKLYELTGQGEIVTTRDLSSLKFRDTQGMVFAPSGDQTDDPSNQNLYIMDRGGSSGKGGIVELTLTPPEQPGQSKITLEFTLIRNVHTWQWNPPSPDPSGIAYIPSSNHLFISDGEVNEMNIYDGANVWEITLTNNPVQDYTTTAFSDEPTGVAYNPNNHHLYFTDDTGTRSVYGVNPGPDGLYFTSDDITTSLRTGDFGCSDPEGITYDTFEGHLFVIDGVNREVYEIDLGPNGVLGGGDDVVTHFDVAGLGIQDPEGVEFNPDNGHLYILGSNDLIVETTRNGSYVQEIDIASLDARKPAGLAYAPTSANPSQKSLYIVARGADNDSNPDENDGEIYEISIGSFTSTPGLSINDVQVLEGNNGTVNAVFTVTLSGASQQTVTVNYATANGSATTGDNDYIAKTGQVSFQPGETNRPITVVVNGDVTEEPDETFFINLSNAVNATIGDNRGTGTIINDDGSGSVTVSFQDGVNGYNGTRDTKLLSGSPTTNYGTITPLEVDGTPDKSSLLYWDLTGIPSGSTVQSVAIQVNVLDVSPTGYEVYELLRSWVESEATWNAYATGQNWQTAGANGSGDRGSTVLSTFNGNSLGINTFSLNAAGVAVVQSWVNDPSSNHGFIVLNYINSNGLDLSSRETATVAQRPKLTVIYTGGTPPTPSLSINDVNVTEGNSGTVNAVFTVNLSSSSTQTVTVNYATADGTAIAPGDYTAASGLVTFPAGQTSQTVTVMANGDVTAEGNETFSVNLSGAANATISDNQGIATITDDDAAPSLSINDVNVTEGNSGTVNAVFTVSLSPSSTQTVTVNYATADGTAIAPGDYTAASGLVTFPAGQTSQTVTVMANGDITPEASETFFVNLSGAANATIGNNQGTGTITNDDTGGGQSVTVSFQDGVAGYSGTRDTKLISREPTANFGSAAELELDSSPDCSALLSWDLAGIPSGSIIQSVDVTVNITNASGHTFEIYELLRPWVEGEATWNQYASGQSWQIAGADGSSDRSSTVLGALIGGKGLATISLNAAAVAVVQGWVDNPSSNHGFIILDYINATNGLDLSSREAGTVTNRPKLTVTYTSTTQARISLAGMSNLPKSPESNPMVEVLPQSVELKPNFPNPFNLETRIEYELPEYSQVNLVIYNIRGQQVRILVDESQSAGFKGVVWNGRDDFGRVVGSGIYFIQLVVDQHRFVRKVLLQK